MGCDRHPIRALGSFHYQEIFAYDQQVTFQLKMNNSKDHISTQFMHRSLWEITTTSKAERLKGDPYIWVCFQALETLERLCLIQTRVNY